MRHIHRVLPGLIAAAVSGVPAGAADPAAPSAQARPAPFVSEVRIGAFAHDPWSPERGSGDVNAEILFAKPFTLADQLADAFVPRPQVGATVNTAGDTSHVYAGVSWTFDITPRIFFEGSLGGAFNNGVAGPVTPAGRSAMGCHAGFRESASLGFRLTEAISLMGTVEHISNAGGCSDNRGLTNVGMRLGYSF